MSTAGPTAPQGGAHEPELDPAFDVFEPEDLTSPLVFSSPHSGRVYPRRFLERSRLDAFALRRSEDAFVDDLFAGVGRLGAPLIRANFPRAYLDVNREPYELDPKMFDGRLPPFVNARSVRVAGGLGTIARVVGESQDIYAGRLDVAEGLARIERLYMPYHAALASLLERAYRSFGIAVLVDCHSMPSTPALMPNSGERRVRTDFVVGDRYGTSCHVTFVEALERAMRARTYVVQRNKPYAGGHITEFYGAPARGIHAVQIEINRSLYMDERSILKTDRFDRVAEDLTAISFALANAVATREFRTAAE